MAKKRRVRVSADVAGSSTASAATSPGSATQGRGPSTPSHQTKSPARGFQLVALLLGACAYTLCLPQFQLWPLAFIALTGLVICATDRHAGGLLDRRRGYLLVWLVGLIHWSITFQFLRLPHWTGYFGVALIGGYAAIYDVAFVWLVRRLDRQNWPVWVSVPLTWTGLEVVRSTILSGIPIGILAHALYRQPSLIQTADLAGELTISLLLASSSAAMASLVFWVRPAAPESPVRWYGQNGFSIAFAVVLLASSYLYGWIVRPRYQPIAGQPAATVALIQGSRDVRFGLTADQDAQESSDAFLAHQSMSVRARQQSPELTAIVWPESMFPALDVLPLPDHAFLWTEEEQKKRNLTIESLLGWQQRLPYFVLDATGTGEAHRPGVELIAGMRSFDADLDRDYNAAIQFDRFGNVKNRYFKSHLVPFGEYLPLGDAFPQLYDLAPIPRGLSQGDGAVGLQVGDATLLPTICYESVIGWHVRAYLLDLQQPPPSSAANNNVEESVGREATDSVDALLNISNDGWFWGSSALDLHLASNVFRAVENRMPHLVASNTGISAEIAPDGAILQETAKRKNEWLIASVPARPDWSPWWWTLGNGPWWFAFAVVVLGALMSLLNRSEKQPTVDENTPD